MSAQRNKRVQCNFSLPAILSTTQENFFHDDPHRKVPLVKYLWTVKNFSMLPDQTLDSPEFGALLYKFRLSLQPYGTIPVHEQEQHVSVRLSRLEDFGDDNTTFMCLMSIIPPNSIGKKICPQIEVIELKKNNYCHWPSLISRNELYRYEVYFSINANVTIKCEIYLVDSKSLGENPLRHLMANVLESGEHSDVVLLAEGKSYHAHKVILESRCPGFLDSLRKVKHPNKFEVHSMTASQLEVLLKYLYTGSLITMKTNEELLSVFEECGLHYLAYAFRNPRLRTIGVTSEVPISTIQFPWVITDLKELKPGNEMVYPAFCIPECAWSKIAVSLMCEDRKAGEDSNVTQNVSLRIRKLDGNQALYMTITVSVQSLKNARQTLQLNRLIRHQFRESEVVIPLSWEKINEHLRGNTLRLAFELVFSKHPAVVKNETASIEKLCNLKLWQRLQQDFGKILYQKDPWFSDAVLQVGEVEFFVHKVFLCIHSPVFERMFMSDFLESERGIVTIEDIKSETVSLLLQYMYGGTVEDLDIADAIDLYGAADKYEIQPLVKKCANLIMSSLDVEHVGAALVLASSRNDMELQSFIYDFMTSNPQAVLECPKTLDALKESPGCFPNIFGQLLKRFPPLD